jgi:phage tail sheath protein FI
MTMPARLTYPGVYVEEQSSGVRTITGVATSTTLFVGMARKGRLGWPTAIRSIDQFETIFGNDAVYGELVPQVRQYFLNGGGEAIIIRIAGAGVSAASVTLRTAGGGDALRLTAKSAGTLGQEIRAIVDYNTATPELTFNLTLFRRSIDANGAVRLSDNEFFADLTMDPRGARYAVTLVTSQSALVDATLPGAALVPSDAGFSQSALLLPMADPATITALNTALGAGNRLVIAVDGGAPVNVTLPSPIAAAALATWLTDAGNAVNAALVANGLAGGATFTLVPFGTNRALRITSSGANGGTSDSVVVTSAAQADATRVLELGNAAGGLELGRYSRFRPQASGFTFELHSRGSGSFADNSDLARLIDFAQATRANLTTWTFNDGSGSPAYSSVVAFPGPGTTFLAGGISAAGAGSLRNTAAHLDTLVAAIAAMVGQAWTVRRTGYRITLSPTFGTSNTGITAALSSTTYDLGAAAVGLASAARAANVQAYSLGASGTGNYQTPGAPGNNGGVPAPVDYNAAFSTAEREIDIFNLLCLPRADGQTDDQRQLIWGSASAFCQRERALLIVDPRSDWSNVDAAAAGIVNVRLGAVTDHAAIYWPRIRVASTTVPIDPGGTVAGIMARTDTRRGVWKAPAGLEASIIGATGLEFRISDPDNGTTNPQAINTLRQFPGGAVIWGARTMAGFDNSGENDYKFIPVRRTALFIEESLYRGLKFAVFEPNDERLWQQIRLACGAFMQNLFRQGAFQGSKASEAYDVRCDATTTTQNDINLGRVNVTVAFAPLRPAEFVVLTVRQLAGQVQT